MQHDLFLSHASEDKAAFVRPLAERLQSLALKVWYDEFSLRPGDSLRKSIDQGLATSRFGVVVLSEAFFAKHWTEWELNGLVQRHLASTERFIIPIWHGINAGKVASYSPSLADIFAIKSTVGIEQVAEQIRQIVNPSDHVEPAISSEQVAIEIATALEAASFLASNLTGSRHRYTVYLRSGQNVVPFASSHPLPVAHTSSFTMPSSIVGRVMQTSTSVVVSDAEAVSDAHFRLASDSTFAVKSILAMPLRLDKAHAPVAVLTMDADFPNAFGPEAIQVARSVGVLVAPFLKSVVPAKPAG